MSDRREWMIAGERYLAAHVPPDLAAPSLLPGWSRAHVVAHLAGNAGALVNLLDWARTGVETPMYASREARDADIERWASRPPEELRDEAVRSSERLLAAAAALPSAAWDVSVRTAQGRTVPASEVWWMRARETWIHAVDLDAGGSFGDLPPDLTDALLTDVTAKVGATDGCPAVELAPSDRDRMWTFGSGTPQAVRGTAGELLGWVLGRPSEVDGLALPRWL
ncbi:MAG TPA: maleylpyruvate isomerase family mycothiol-dependent enzyme [Mycobacteriales bacterium]|jgi:maleylpyruvate isomerase|nr:maleylpyruvate isomerase family mycothiol-dependent enzyme [Mycobacteriales bacterium]